MIIGASSVGMNSNRNYKANSRHISYLQAWDNSTGAQLGYMNGAADSVVSNQKSDEGLQESVRNLFENIRDSKAGEAAADEAKVDETSDEILADEKAESAEDIAARDNAIPDASAASKETGAGGAEKTDKSQALSGDELYKKAASDLKYSLDAISIPKKSDLSEKIEQMKRLRQQTIDYLLRIIFGKNWREHSKSNSDYIASDENYYHEESGTTTDYSSLTSFGDFDSSKIIKDGEINLDELGEGVGGNYYNHYEYSEQESMSFSTTGKVITEDGREIEFNVELSMSRSFYEASETYIDFGAAKCIDPLVINLEGNVTSVEDQKFFFDLDSDGKAEEISRLSKGSGYLALDKNGDGQINDGSELFGTESGNGFADLARYDSDGNGWIDEADEIFDKLLIWQMDENGQSSLVGLGQAGVGAIYLGAENTEFSLKDQMNNTNAIIRKTGIFVYEDGNVGTMSQLDLAT